MIHRPGFAIAAGVRSKHTLVTIAMYVPGITLSRLADSMHRGTGKLHGITDCAREPERNVDTVRVDWWKL